MDIDGIHKILSAQPGLKASRIEIRIAPVDGEVSNEAKPRKLSQGEAEGIDMLTAFKNNHAAD